MDLEAIYEAHFRDVYRFLLGLTENGPLAEELCQETFFKALKAARRFDGSQDARAWLFTIARNCFYGSAIPAIGVYNPTLYTARSYWAEYADSIYELE